MRSNADTTIKLMLTERQKRVLAFLERKLQKPTWKFILIDGVLLWGIPMGIAVFFINYFFINNSAGPAQISGLILSIVMFAFGGVLYGFIIRQSYKKQHTKLRQKESL